jgi:hypothetical protein
MMLTTLFQQRPLSNQKYTDEAHSFGPITPETEPGRTPRRTCYPQESAFLFSYATHEKTPGTESQRNRHPHPPRRQ